MTLKEKILIAIVAYDPLVTDKGREWIAKTWPKGWEDERENAMAQADAIIRLLDKETKYIPIDQREVIP